MQFIQFARNELISNEMAWEVFLEHPDSIKISKDKLKKIKNILFGHDVLSLHDIKEHFKKYNHCHIIPILYSMVDGNLSPNLVHMSNKIISISIQEIIN